MKPEEYQQLAARTECNQEAASSRRLKADGGSYNAQFERWEEPKLLATRLTHAALGLAGEAGELAYAVEKWLQYGKPLDKTNILEEVGDVLWYLALACNSCGLSLEDAMEKNIAKLRARYPEKYSDHLAAEENRDREQERAILEVASTCRNSKGEVLQIDTLKPVIKVSIESAAEKQVVGDPMEFIRQQTGPRPASPICWACKTPLSDSARFCPNCGKDVRNG